MITISIQGLSELEARLGRFPPLYQRATRNLLTRAGYAVQAEAQARTPAGTFNTVKPSTGTLRRSMATMVDPSPFPTWAKVGTNLPYGPFIESGVRTDPRVRKNGGKVYRRLGPARMLAQGAVAALPRVRAALAQFVDEIKAGL